MDWTKKFSVTNKSGAVIISGVLTIEHGTTETVDPTRHPEKTVEDLKIFLARDSIEVSNNIPESMVKGKDSFAGVRKVNTANGPDGDKHEHFIFDGEIDLSGKAIETGSERSERLAKAQAEADAANEEIPLPPTKEVANDEKISHEEAIKLLSKHWKTVEAEVNKIDDPRKLNFLLVVAIEEKVADKKKQIIQTRLEQI